MDKILKTEIKRSFHNKFFLAALLISTILVLWYSFERIPFCIEKNAAFSTDFVHDDFLEVSYTNWIGSHNMFLQQNIFYIIIPILAVLPFGGSLFTDINGGYIKNICVRTKKSRYLLAKYVAVFISGGTVTVLPMIFSFLISAAFLPTMRPEVSYAYTNIFSIYKWASLFFAKPFLYVLLYLFVTFIFSGLLACMSLGITYCASKGFLPLIFPFFVYIIFSLFFELINLPAFSIRNMITTTGQYSTTISVCITAAVLFVLSFFPYYFIGVKQDVL